MKVVPVPSSVPPVAASYHFTVPVLGFAVSVTEPAPHLSTLFAVIVGIGLMVATTAVLELAVHPLNASA